MAQYKVKVNTTIPVEMMDYCKKNGIPYARVIELTWRFIYMDSPETQQRRIDALKSALQEQADRAWKLEQRVKKLEGQE